MKDAKLYINKEVIDIKYDYFPDTEELEGKYFYFYVSKEYELFNNNKKCDEIIVNYKIIKLLFYNEPRYVYTHNFERIKINKYFMFFGFEEIKIKKLKSDKEEYNRYFILLPSYVSFMKTNKINTNEGC